MRSKAAVVATLLLAACSRSHEAPAPMLTLWPAAMRVTGASLKLDDHTLCIVAGTKAEADVFVDEWSSVVVVAFTSTPETPPSLAVRLGTDLLAMETIRSTRAEASISATAVGRGEKVLSFMVPETVSSAAVLCLHQVLVIQR